MAAVDRIGRRQGSVCKARREFLLAAFGLAFAAHAGAAPARRIVVFGDSLSAGYGMAREEAWPSLLAQRLRASSAGAGWEVVNASISGETTHGGMARLKSTLDRLQPAVVILELGGNDALRGMPLADMRRNLEQMAALIQAQGARLLIVGVALPPNFGADYTREFASVFAQTARQRKATLVANLVESLGTGREDFQADGIHPLARVQDKLLASVMRGLAPLIGVAP